MRVINENIPSGDLVAALMRSQAVDARLAPTPAVTANPDPTPTANVSTAS